jgi:signal transduction histidine kinase
MVVSEGITMRTLASRLRPKSFRQTLLFMLVVWNPVIAAGFAFAFSGTADFAANAAAVLVIVEVSGSLGFASVHLGKRLAKALARRGEAWRARSRFVPFATTTLLMPAWLPLAFAAGSRTARALGVEWGALDARTYRLGVAIGLLFTTLFFFRGLSVKAEDDARAAERRAKELENARLRAQLAALTAEMNPHLLFNALNTVAALIHRDPDRAEEVVLHLSELYRGVLRSARSAMHPLADELRLCEAYLRVEHARFGERFIGEIVVDPGIDTEKVRVPVLVLQPFVENAVEHGLSQRAKGGRLSVGIRKNGERLDITIEDDGVGFGRSTRTGAGKAISNCKERLALSYGDRASLALGPREEGGARVVVSLPVGSEDHG